MHALIITGIVVVLVSIYNSYHLYQHRREVALNAAGIKKRSRIDRAMDKYVDLDD